MDYGELREKKEHSFWVQYRITGKYCNKCGIYTVYSKSIYLYRIYRYIVLLYCTGTVWRSFSASTCTVQVPV